MNVNKKKSILITGCSTGIGRCLAEGLRDSGFHVIASCRSQEDVSTLSDSGLDAILLDVRDSGSIVRGVEKALSLCNGKLYGLINNAGYGQPGAVEDLSRSTLREQFETNVFGAQELTNLVLPAMREQNQGRIIQISSILGVICLKFRGAYNASKSALEALTDTMRLELADTNIKCCLIEPGPITSDFRKNALLYYEQNVIRDRSPFKQTYERLESRLNQQRPSRFTLGPEAVLEVVLHALNNPKPKIRYPVTVPTKVMFQLKRLLPDQWMDRFLLRISNKE
ncbi:MAG: SDR family NAD(P)-dependent oxidoreductase [Gammaproteobacteria bacterium]|nr:SDR family NAD(P)-dependent oxidoreductase [Gammaproteobacteria bacterium]